MLCDCHCHLEFEQFDRDREQVLERARDILVIDSVIRPQHVKTAFETQKIWPNIRVCLGLSPCDLENMPLMTKHIRERQKDIAAIGEVGLDYHWVKDEKGRSLQLKAFESFIDMSEKLGVGLVLHTRCAEDKVIEMMAERDVKALMHCFSGSVSQALEAAGMGCLISVPTNVAYLRKRQKIAKAVPLENICLETDSPYLCPQPGKRNEPANVGRAYEAVAKARGISQEKLEDAVFDNLGGFFRL